MNYLKKISILTIIAVAAVSFVSADTKCPATCSDKAAEKVVCKDTEKCGTAECPINKDGVVCGLEASSAVEDPTIAAKAGDVVITIEEVNELVEPRLQGMPDEVKGTQSKLIKKRALDSLIFQKLLEKKFEENKIEVSDKQLDDEIVKILAENDITVDEFKERVASMGRDFEEFRSQVRNGMKYQKMMDLMAGEGSKITDEDVKAFYQSNPQRFQQEAEVKASHILVKTEPEATEEQKAAAKVKIVELLKKVNAGGDFAELAKENSDCPSSSNGGDLGFFARGRMVKPFSDAAFALKVGDVSDVVETQFGYHIIKVTDRKDAKTITFEDAKEDIKAQLEDNSKREFAGKFREDLLKESEITYYNEFKTQERQPQQMQIVPQPE